MLREQLVDLLKVKENLDGFRFRSDPERHDAELAWAVSAIDLLIRLEVERGI